MKLTQRQAMQLMALLQSSLSKNVVGYLCYDIKQRTVLLNEIINQQDNKKPIDLLEAPDEKLDA